MSYETDFDDSIILLEEKERYDKEHKEFVKSLKKYGLVGEE